MPQTHLIKLSVGTESPETLAQWQARPEAQTGAGLPCHITRMWPKRADEILGGGSLYWVIKGAIQARQRVLDLQEVIGADGVRRCAIVLDPEIILTQTALRRPFQGWRYLKPEDAPADLVAKGRDDDALPPELSAALAEIGVR